MCGGDTLKLATMWFENPDVVSIVCLTAKRGWDSWRRSELQSKMSRIDCDAKAKAIDKDGGTKNCWTYAWLEASVDVEFKIDGKVLKTSLTVVTEGKVLVTLAPSQHQTHQKLSLNYNCQYFMKEWMDSKLTCFQLCAEAVCRRRFNNMFGCN